MQCLKDGEESVNKLKVTPGLDPLRHAEHLRILQPAIDKGQRLTVRELEVCLGVYYM